MREKLVGISVVSVLVLFGSMASSFAEESLSWKSEYLVGILESENDALIPVTISTFSKDSLKLEWQIPEITKNQKIIGYEILRKDLNSDYQNLVEITNPKKTSYLDMNLEKGYYGYKVIPVLQKTASEIIPMHGIDRTHNLFPMYVEGQQLLAQYSLNQNCQRCSDESFEEIDDTFQYEFSKDSKRTVKEHQFNINSEMFRTTQIFEILFNIRNNH